jgi:hypothetical protein
MKLSLLSFLFLLGATVAHELRGAVIVEEKTAAVEDAPQGRRELFDIWQFLMLLGPHPGPHHHDDSSGSSSSGSDSSSGSTEESYGEDAEEAYSQTGDYERNTNPSGAFNSGSSKAAMWMMWVALVAAAVAAMAIVAGQRKKNPEQHKLTGSVARRAALFGAFADSALCAHSEKRTVEMTLSHDSQQANLV